MSDKCEYCNYEICSDGTCICVGFEIRELQSKLDCAVKALEFTLPAAENLYCADKEVSKGLPAIFYHTLTYEGDVALVEKCKRARLALEEIKNGNN